MVDPQVRSNQREAFVVAVAVSINVFKRIASAHNLALHVSSLRSHPKIGLRFSSTQSTKLLLGVDEVSFDAR